MILTPISKLKEVSLKSNDFYTSNKQSLNYPLSQVDTTVTGSSVKFHLCHYQKRKIKFLTF